MEAQLADGPLRLGDGDIDILDGHDADADETLGVDPAEVSQPVVVGAAQGGGQHRVGEAGDAKGGRGIEDGDIDLLLVEVLEPLPGVVTPGAQGRRALGLPLLAELGRRREKLPVEHHHVAAVVVLDPLRGAGVVLRVQVVDPDAGGFDHVSVAVDDQGACHLRLQRSYKANGSLRRAFQRVKTTSPPVPRRAGEPPPLRPGEGDQGRGLDGVSEGHLQSPRLWRPSHGKSGAGRARAAGGRHGGPTGATAVGEPRLRPPAPAVRGAAPFSLAVAAGKADAAQGEHPHPTATLTGAEEALLRVIDGEIDVTHLLASGELKSSGDYYHVIDLSRLALAVQQSRAR